MHAVVQFSGGAGSWAAAKRVVAQKGFDDVTLLFADTLIEDEDLYRFLDDAATDIGVPITRVADGRTPWEVFRDVRYIGNTRVDPCSKVLKRDLLRRWIEDNCDPQETVVVLGIDWTELHRLERAAPRWEPWTLWAPLCEETETDKESLLVELREAGIRPPRLYEMGFPHNNCGGFCVKAGQAQFKKLYEEMPDRYVAHELEEELLRQHLGKDVSILRDRSKAGIREHTDDPNVKAVPLTLRRFRERMEAGGEVDPYDWGGCGCALD